MSQYSASSRMKHVKCCFSNRSRESLYDAVIQRVPPVWMEALERFQRCKGHRFDGAVWLTNAVNRDRLVFAIPIPICRKNYGELFWGEDWGTEREWTRSW